jgi:hypothetical protein
MCYQVEKNTSWNGVDCTESHNSTVMEKRVSREVSERSYTQCGGGPSAIGRRKVKVTLE